MDNLLRMQVFERHHHLIQIILGFEFGESFSSFDEFIQGLMGTHFHQNVDIVMVFEDVFELDDVLMFDGTVDLYLTDELES